MAPAECGGDIKAIKGVKCGFFKAPGSLRAGRYFSDTIEPEDFRQRFNK